MVSIQFAAKIELNQLSLRQFRRIVIFGMTRNCGPKSGTLSAVVHAGADHRRLDLSGGFSFSDRFRAAVLERFDRDDAPNRGDVVRRVRSDCSARSLGHCHARALDDHGRE